MVIEGHLQVKQKMIKLRVCGMLSVEGAFIMSVSAQSEGTVIM